MTAGRDYPMGFSFHPDERPLELTRSHLDRIRETLDENGRRRGRYVLPELQAIVLHSVVRLFWADEDAAYIRSPSSRYWGALDIEPP